VHQVGNKPRLDKVLLHWLFFLTVDPWGWQHHQLSRNIKSHSAKHMLHPKRFESSPLLWEAQILHLCPIFFSLCPSNSEI